MTFLRRFCPQSGLVKRQSLKMKCAFVLCCIVGVALAGFPPKPTEILRKIQNKIDKAEKGCSPPFPMKGLNITWMNSVDKWYILGSDRVSFDLFLEGLNETQKLEACITSNSLGYPEQFYHKVPGGEPKFFRPTFNPIRIGEIDWTIRVNGTEEFLSATTIVDSDNESYFIGYDYWPGGKPGIWVSGVGKTVPQKVHDIAMEKMELLAGFTNAKEHYLKMDNSKCP